jgi:8-amino-7-oxononanoate synthase
VLYLIEGLKKIEGLQLANNSRDQSHIQGVIVPGNEEVLAKAQALQSADIYAVAVRKPTVAEGQERIRICVHAYNTKSEIDLLLKTLDT